MPLGPVNPQDSSPGFPPGAFSDDLVKTSMVEVVYVCSPDYWRQLFLSIRSLYASGSNFDSVRIFVTADEHPGWDFNRDEIKVSTVPDIGGGFWMLNKTHLCRSDCETVVFLDVDAIVIGKIDGIYDGVESDIIARCAPRVEYGYHDKKEWKERISKYGCSNYPYLSSGFVIFKNRSQKDIKDRWIKVTKKILKGEEKEDPDWHANQDAFSITCCVEGVELSLMEEREHAYAMMGESPEGSIVYHLGMPNFYHYYFIAEEHIDTREKSMPVQKPGFLDIHRVKNRLVRKVKSKLGWEREAKPNWSKN